MRSVDTSIRASHRVQFCAGHNGCRSCLLRARDLGGDILIVYDPLYSCAWNVRKGGEWRSDAGPYSMAMQMELDGRDRRTEVGGRRVGCMVFGTSNDSRIDPWVVRVRVVSDRVKRSQDGVGRWALYKDAGRQD